MQHSLSPPPPSADLELLQQSRSPMLPGAVPDDDSHSEDSGGGRIASPSAAAAAPHRTAQPQPHQAGYTRVQMTTPLHLSIPMRADSGSGGDDGGDQSHVTAGAPSSPSALTPAAAAASAASPTPIPSAAVASSLRKLRADNSKFVRLLSECKRDALMLQALHALLALILVLVCAAILNLTPMQNLPASTDLVWSTGTIAALASALVLLAAAGMVAQSRKDSARDPWDDAPQVIDDASTNEQLRAKAKAVARNEQRYFLAGVGLTLALLILGLLLQVFSADLNHSAQAVWDNVDERASIVSHFDCCGFTAGDSAVPLLCAGVGGALVNTTTSCATPVRQALHTQAQGVSVLALVFAPFLLISLFLWLRFGSIRVRFQRAESRSLQEREDDELDSLLDGSLPPEGCLDPRENFVVWQYPDKPRDCSGCCWAITSTRINLRTAPASDQLREAKPLLLNEAQANRLRARLMDGAAELQNRRRSCDTAVNVSSLITGCIVALLVVIQVLVASTEPESSRDRSAAGFAYIYASLPILAAFIEQCCGQVRKRAMADLADIESSLKLLNAHMEHEFLIPDLSGGGGGAAAAPEEAASMAKVIDLFGKLTPDHSQLLKNMLDKAHSSASVGTATAGGDIRRMLEGGIGGLGAGFNSGVNGLRNEIGGAIGGLGSNAHAGINGLRGQIGGALGGLGSSAQSNLNGLRGDFSGAAGGLGSNANAGLHGLRGDVGGALGGLSSEAQQQLAALQVLRGDFGGYGGGGAAAAAAAGLGAPLSPAQRASLEAILAANSPGGSLAWRPSAAAAASPSNAAAAVADARSAATAAALGMGPEWLSAATAASLSPAHAVHAAALDARAAATNALALGSPTSPLAGSAASWLAAPNAAVTGMGLTAQEAAEVARSAVANAAGSAPTAATVAGVAPAPPMRVSAPMSMAPPSVARSAALPPPSTLLAPLPAAAAAAAATAASVASAVSAAPGSVAPWFASQVVDPSVQAMLDSMAAENANSAAFQQPPSSHQQPDPRTPPNARAREPRGHR